MKLGGNWKSSKVTDDILQAAINRLNAAINIGYRHFDHADIYCLGKSQIVFGQWLEQLKEHELTRQDLLIQSKAGVILPEKVNENYKQKLPGRYDFSKEHIFESIHNSLRNLNIEHLDAFLLHRPDLLMNPRSVAKTLDEIIDQKLATKVGVSNFSAPQIDLIQNFMNHPISISQIEFNPSFADLLANGLAPKSNQPQVNNFFFGLYEYCFKNDIEIQAYSPFAAGKIRTPVNDKHNSILNQTIQEVAKETGKTFEQVVVAWIQTPAIAIKPVIGTTDLNRLSNIFSSKESTLSKPQWYRIFNAGREQGVP